MTDKPLTRREIEAAHPGVFWGHLPSPTQYALWRDWIAWDEGSGDDGWILGWCPLHDKEKETMGSGEFNFNSGAMRCHGDPRCFPRRALSLTNLALRMRTDGE
jgi:hypothetical protein